MKFKIVEGKKLGFPARLHGKTVEAERVSPDTYRLTDKGNEHLRFSQRCLERQEVELIEESSSADAVAAAYAQAVAAAYAQVMAGDIWPWSPPSPVADDDDDFIDISGIGYDI
jgi:hypothetical protein